MPESRYPSIWVAPLLFALSACSGDAQQAPMEFPPTPVGVVELAPQSVALTTSLPGRTQAFRVAEIRPRINGIIEQRLFQEGGEVDAGEVLYLIEDSTYRAAVNAAEANVAQAEAAHELARLRNERLQPLLARQTVSQQEFDEAVASLHQAEAAVAAARAQLETARISLQYTRITSPISGRADKSEFTEGALVTALQGEPLTTVRQLDPIYVEFSQSVNVLMALRKQALDLGMNPASRLPVYLIMEDGSRYDQAGELEFAEVNVDEATGTVTLRAVFPNPDSLLLPGMFVRAELTQLQLDSALTVPQQAVQRDASGGASVWVIGSEGTVEVRPIEIGHAIEDQWLVEAGLQFGDQVIVDSLQKIGPGTAVSPIPTQLN